MSGAGPECASHHKWALWRTGADFCFFNHHFLVQCQQTCWPLELKLEDLVSLANGYMYCVCCSLRKNIVRALAELDRRASAHGKPFDGVFLETTGLADPAPIAFTFFANPLDSITLQAQQHIVSVKSVHRPLCSSILRFGTTP